jgi:aldehyde:ferredoxin oxidoreductase
MYGLYGKILRINLTDGKIKTEKLPESDAKFFVGGKGLAINLLYRELEPKIDPLGSKNKLVYAIGPINKTGIPGDTRFVVAGKSPLTNIWGEGNCSGWFADGLKNAGYDALVIEGASNSPVYIQVSDDEAEIKNATHLCNKWTAETERIIKNESKFKDIAIIAEGPASENLVKFSAITHTAHRAAGRTGLGAIMGSKKLKAIAVRGTKKIEIAFPEKVKELQKTIAKETFENKFTSTLREHGQAGFLLDLNNDGILPTKNFQSGVFYGAEKISGQAMTKQLLKSRESCPRCPVSCKRVVEVKDGPFAPVLKEYGGPEYENLAALGSLLLIDNLEAVCRMNMICNAYSLDTISTGVSVAFAMECYEKGILTIEDTGGLELYFGNAVAALKLIEKIAFREGLGNILANGVKEAAKTIGHGSEKFAVEIKGLEIPMHEPRGKKGLAVMYATSARGGCHMQSMHDPDIESPNMAPEIGMTKALNRFDTSREKVLYLKKTGDWTAMINSLGLCSNIYWFGAVYYKPHQLTEILNAVTDWGFTVEDFMITGERINTLCRMFNIREGLTKTEDTLPSRFFEPLIGGPTNGYSISIKEFESMLRDYYEICGWDPDTGIPTGRRLKELGLQSEVT